MAKKELGLAFSDALGGNTLIDTETGKVITENAPVSETEEEEKKENDNLIDINETKVSGSEEDEHTDDDDTLDHDEPSSLPHFKVLVKALHEKGIISEFDEKLLDSDDKEETDKLFDLIKSEIEKNTEEKYSEKIKSLPDNIKTLIGEGEAKKQIAGDVLQIRTTKESLEKITDDQISENEDLQKNIIAESLKQRGYSDEKIKKRISQFDDLGALEEESKDALKEIISGLTSQESELIKQAELKQEQIEKDRENDLKKIKKEVFDADHIIDGIPLTEKEQDLIYDSMTKIIDKDKDGTPMNAVMATRAKNPLAFEKALHYYHALGLFNIDKNGELKPDISKIRSSAKSSAVDELSKALKKEQRTQSGRPARENKMDREALKKRIERMKAVLPL